LIEEELITSLIKEVAEDRKIVSACLYGSRVCGYSRRDSDYDVLLILRDYQEGVRYNYKNRFGTRYAFLVVDKDILEQDSKKGVLGDFVSGRLLSPYVPKINEKYIRSIELQTKKRIIEEELRSLVIQYGELSRGLVIKPEYIVLSRMWKRLRIYPPLRYSYTKMLHGDIKEKNMESILNGYYQVLDDMAKSELIQFDEQGIVIKNKYLDRLLSRRVYVDKFIDIVNTNIKAFTSYITHSKAGQVGIDIVTKELTTKFLRGLEVLISKTEFEDPKNHLFLKTSKGLVNLSEKKSLSDLFHKLNPHKKISVSPLPGVLNEVYIITIDGEKLVAKRFTDWYSFKWLLLNMLAFGTKTFALSGRTRLSNEYGLNRLLAENGISVPEVISINLHERLLIKKYIDGVPLLRLILRKNIRKKHLNEEEKKLAYEIGRTVAQIHSLDVCIGDCKPENFIYGIDKKVYILDLEQGEKKGDKSWDIAEFLLYSGHYHIHNLETLIQFTEEFIKGYKEDGDKEILRKAAGLRYLKVFIFWTPMPVIQTIAELLKK
jgi:tRNA A-37 threonylcarbamoyl transferase component Bud32/predicted nucleotidyltransferase